MAERFFLRVGDPIVWMDAWGRGPKLTGRIEAMDLTMYPREKYGEDVQIVDLTLVRANRVLISANTGKWLYSEQLLLNETLEAIRQMEEEAA